MIACMVVFFCEQRYAVQAELRRFSECVILDVVFTVFRGQSFTKLSDEGFEGESTIAQTEEKCKIHFVAKITTTVTQFKLYFFVVWL